MTESILPTSKRDLFLSVGLCLLVLGAIELAFRTSSLFRGLQAESLYVAKARELSNSDRDIGVVFTGDSRILHGVHPLAVQAAIKVERDEELYVYNAALPGAPPMAQLAMILRLLSREKPPRLAVISISPYMFSSRINAAMARESLSAIWRIGDIGSAFRAGASAEDLAVIVTSDLLSLYRYRPRLLDALMHFRGVGAPAGTGLQGFLQNGEVDVATQDARARGRAEGYRIELLRPAAELGNEHMGYFVEALRALQGAGVKTLVLNSPSASQVDIAYGPESIYEEHIAWTRARAAELGAEWVDVKSSPAIGDEDYVDGDHLGGSGAARFSAWLAHAHIVPALGGRRSDRPEGCKTLFGFETESLQRWTKTGSAFEQPMRVQSLRFQHPVYGHVGRIFLSTFGAAGDRDVGEASSPAFLVSGSSVRMLVGGGAHLSQSAGIVVEGQEVAVARGTTNEGLHEVVLDTRDVRGRSAVLRIRDQGTGPFEHINVDHVAICP